jgi:phage-related minor tail protein
MSPNDPIETWSIAIEADTSGLEDQLKNAATAGKQFSSALITAFDSAAIKGKSLGDVVSTLALKLSDVALKAAFKPLEDGLANTFSSLLAGGFSGTGFANGGAFANGIPTPFASGGVIQSPIAFPLGGGQSGIAGERGAEAILPLARGPDGKLGVASSGGGGSPINVTFNVQATDADSFARSETQLAALLSRAVALGQRNL